MNSMLTARSLFVASVAFVCTHVAYSAEPTAAQLEFFESRIRPVLVEHCFECHSDGKKIKGGLRLDTRDGWATGGDSGPAIEPGKPDESLLIEALRSDGGLKMPPKSRLPQSVIDDFVRWVEQGAVDPRNEVSTGKRTGIDLDAGRQHWSYMPVVNPPIPEVRNRNWPRNSIDAFILAQLEAAELQPAPEADRVTLVRRIYFDLIGLPPSPAEIDTFLADTAPNSWERLVDRLLASPQFGERWGRHWLDVVRFAESLTLRGFILKDAWRYRDYVIEAFDHDLPFDEFLREQVAGDLLTSDSVAVRKRRLVATTVLMLGNTNLEEQDKKQLEMDVVDEQLDLIGRGFLAQTITCARCHDHKFDPIPTRDYYALAGILKNSKALEHENVSKWIEVPLPLYPEQEAEFVRHESALAALDTRLSEVKQALKQAAGPAVASLGPDVLAAVDLPGIVVDDAEAKRVGEWQGSKYSKRYIGDGYIHDIDGGKGKKTLSFEPELPASGRYEVRLAYTPGDNRATKVPVTVFSADGEKTIEVNEKEVPPLDGRFISLGQYRFERDGQSFVIVSNAGTQGHVIADAVQFLPISEGDGGTAVPAEKRSGPPSPESGEVRDLKKEISRLEGERKQLVQRQPKRPMVISVLEQQEPVDLPIHIRGSVHNLGDLAPRGFLQVATTSATPSINSSEGGRRQLADWLGASDNPLPARVFVNRAWHWLFGSGLVRTTDNFGTTGELPSHPELLDHLASEFMTEGWSMKRLIRKIVLSRTYRQAVADDPRGRATDPENRLLWRMNRRRLDAECLRDAMLSVAGGLQADRGGPGYRAELAADYGYLDQGQRRSVYVPVFRNALPELFEVFDFADPSTVTGRRNVSTVAPQALFLMNHPFVIDQSRQAAKRILAETATDTASRIVHTYRMILGREPTTAEQSIALQSLNTRSKGTTEEEDSDLDQWSQLIQALFATIEFRYVE